jgi:hypothetical protein
MQHCTATIYTQRNTEVCRTACKLEESLQMWHLDTETWKCQQPAWLITLSDKAVLILPRT